MTTEIQNWTTDLEKVLRGTDQEQRHKGMATILNLPRIDELPRGGQVSGWESKDWADWAVANGYEQGERTKHGQVWLWSQFPKGVFLSIPSSMGDPRAGMNMMRDIRQRYRTAYDAIGVVALDELENGGSPTIEEFRATVLKKVRTLKTVDDYIDVGKARNTDSILDVTEANALDAKRLLNLLKKEFDLSPRIALRRCNFMEDEIERMVAKLNSGVPFRTAGSVVSTLNDLLETEREAVQVEKDRKRKEREQRELAQATAKEAMKVMPGSAVAPRMSAAEKHAEGIRRLRQTLDGNYQRITGALRQALELTMSMHESVDMLPYPAPPVDEGEALRKTITEMDTELTAARIKVSNLETQIEIDQQSNLGIQNEVTKLRQELTDLNALISDPTQTDPFRLKYEGLVTSLKPLLFGTGDISAMLANLEEAKKVVRGADADIVSLRKAEGKKP